MFIFILNSRNHQKSGPRTRQTAGNKLRFRRWIAVSGTRTLLLAVMILTTAWPVDPAAAIEFVTREAFSVEKSRYKDYPYRVLFEKFHASEGDEKRALRNVIILKQVFDPDIRRRALAAGATFEAFYGVIKTVNKNRLRLWLPESDSFKDFPVGIDRVPVENKQDYPALAANISRFAAIVHTLDNRVYKIEIRFALTAPEKPKVLRRAENNVVSWQPPENVQAPSAYRVFVNGKLYKTVTGTSVEIPRSETQADEFFVKAVYTHQKGRIVSAASPTLYDAASAAEIRQRQRAGDLYRQLTAALGRTDRPAARKLLDENLPLLTGFLSPDRKSLALTTAAFFKALDEGERLTTLRPETPENLVAARKAFQQASQTAGRLPAEYKLSQVADARLKQNSALTAELTVRRQKEKARQTLAQIFTDLKPDRWQQARNYLYRQQEFLLKHLDKKEKAGMLALAGFFQDIEKGDLNADIEPPAVEHLETAIQNYRQAEKKGRLLPANLDAGFIARQKIKTAANRRAALAAEEKTRLASQAWDKLTVALNPSEWQTAKSLLHANRSLLSENLPAESKAAMAILVDFFASLDEGDRLAASQPSTLENLDTATGYYRRAARKAETLPDSLDVEFITRLKTGEIEKLKTGLVQKKQETRTRKIYDRIMTALTPKDWKIARSLLSENDAVLATQLDPARKATVAWLNAFFQFIADGDRLNAQAPVTLDNLNMALASYRLADQKARDRADTVDMTFLSGLKIEKNRAQQTALKLREKQTQALQTAAPSPAPAPTPPPAPIPTDTFDKSVDKKTALKLALQSFSGQQYVQALRYFEKAYAKKIRKLKKAGRKQSFAVLGIPPRIRAEIIFLVQLDLIKSRSDEDEDLLRDGLMEMQAEVEEGIGAWSIIAERKRNKIIRHIERYPF